MFQQGIQYERFYGPQLEPLELRRQRNWLPVTILLALTVLLPGMLMYLP